MPRPLALTDTIADHHAISRVTANCAVCGHVSVLDTWVLGTRQGWDLPLSELAGRLRCSSCGARACRLAVALRRPPRRLEP